ncbi:MAG: SDR family NAD(P)-dependent oxidoreductase [Bradymonadia bacterium]|jgi:3-oxoacyl-[acyl-carrier protein] reductase
MKTPTSCILVLGATGGIGHAVVTDLVSEGHRPLLSARREAPLRALADEVDAPWHTCDARDPAQVEALLDWADAQAAPHGGLAGVVHAVGSILLKPATRTTDAEWAEVIAQNLTSAFHVVRAAPARLAARGGGAVVLFSTAAAHIGLPNHEAIAAAKAGVEGLVRSAAATWAGKGVRFNVVAPGLVETPLSASLTRPGPGLEMSQRMHALGRIGQPVDLLPAINAALFSPWMSGQVLVVDGGLSGLKIPR